MSEIDFVTLINSPHEERWLEFKRTMAWSDRGSRARIIKSILAMSNIRNGGWIVIGKEDQGDGTFNPTGMTQEDFDTYNPEHIKTDVNNYADPYAIFNIEKREDNGRLFVLLRVYEFNEIPVICKRSYGDILQDGVMYTRSRGRPESIPVPSQSEMREIIRMATTKAVRRWLEQMQEIGLRIPTVPGEDDDERFLKQLEDLI